MAGYVRIERMHLIRKQQPQRKGFQPFTSVLSASLLFGLYVGWASLFFL